MRLGSLTLPEMEWVAGRSGHNFRPATYSPYSAPETTARAAVSVIKLTHGYRP